MGTMCRACEGDPGYINHSCGDSPKMPPPGPSESGFWDRCVCGAPRGAHGKLANPDPGKGNWIDYANPCKRFRKAPPGPPIVPTTPPRWHGPGLADDEKKARRRKKKPDPFLDALKAETTRDWYGDKTVRRLR